MSQECGTGHNRKTFAGKSAVSEQRIEIERSGGRGQPDQISALILAAEDQQWRCLVPGSESRDRLPGAGKQLIIQSRGRSTDRRARRGRMVPL